MTTEEFFGPQRESREIFDLIANLIAGMGESEVQASKSQIAFRTRKNFAAVWMPKQYLKGKAAPLVLSLSFSTMDPSPRWKEVVRISPGRFTHHLELWHPSDVDDEVGEWLCKARNDSI